MPRKQQVLQITQYLHPGGLERMIWKLSQELQRQGYGSDIFVYDQTQGRSIQKEIEASGIKVHAHFKEPGFSWRTLKTLRGLLRSGEFDAVHSHDLGALIYTALANAGPGSLRHVHTQHSFIHLKKHARYAWYERIFARQADKLVVVAPHQAEAYAALGLRSQVIPNGVEYPDQNPFLDPTRKTAIKTALISSHESIHHSNSESGAPLKLQDKWVLIPGRIQRNKGQLHVIEFIDQLSPDEVEGVQFIFLGAAHNDEENQIFSARRQRSAHSKRISYVGFQADPLKWMISADGIISFSEFEGLPLVGLESRGMGLPTLLSDIEAHRPLASSGTWLTDIRDFPKARQWLQLLQNEGFPKSAESWDMTAQFREDHSLARMAGDYLAAYQKPTSGKGWT